MAVEKVTITVERLGKFGVLSGGLWYNLSSKSGLKISDFSPMTSYDILVYTSDGGKKYINQIVGTSEAVAAPVTPPVLKEEVDTERAKRVTAPSKVGEVDWDKKNAQIRAQGTIQAAVESPALQMFAANYDEWVALVEKTAKFELDFISKNS